MALQTGQASGRVALSGDDGGGSDGFGERVVAVSPGDAPADVCGRAERGRLPAEEAVEAGQAEGMGDRARHQGRRLALKINP